MIREDRFYVYSHRLVSTNEVICIGSGSGYRMRDKNGRNKQWNEITKDNAWYFSFLKKDMTKFDSEELEVALIDIYKPKGNTRVSSISSKKLDILDIDRKYYYDETSPSCLRYKIDNGGYGFRARKAGDVVSRMHNTPSGIRYSISNGGTSRAAHRAVWYLCTGEDPVGFVIDHIDGDSSNNKIVNLRKVTTLENNRNVKLKKNNVTGYKGVQYTSEGFYVATWHDSLIHKWKTFSCLKHGEDLALALAVEYRHFMITKLAESGQIFSERHTGVHTRHAALKDMTDDVILKLFECELTVRNTSQTRGVFKSEYNGKVLWTYGCNQQGSKEYRSFSVPKYGDLLAKSLAVEFAKRHQGFEHNCVEGFSLLETNTMLQDRTLHRNVSGITGLSFKSTSKGEQVYVQISVDNRKYGKRLWISKLGLLESIAEAIRWRRSFSKN